MVVANSSVLQRTLSKKQCRKLINLASNLHFVSAFHVRHEEKSKHSQGNVDLRFMDERLCWRNENNGFIWLVGMLNGEETL